MSNELHRTITTVNRPPDTVVGRAVPRTINVEDADHLSLGFVMRAIGRWWTIALPLGLLLAVGSVAAVHYLVDPKYRATAWIQIEDSTPYVVAPAHPGASSSNESRRFVQTQIELMRSPLVIAPVLTLPEVQAIPELRRGWNAPTDRLAKQLHVLPVGESELYEICFDSVNPEQAALVVNAIVDEYFNRRSESTATRSQRVIELLDQEKERRGNEVTRLQTLIRDLGKDIAEKNQLPPEHGVVVMSEHPLQKLRERLTATQVERHVLEAKVRAYQESSGEQEFRVSEAAVARELESFPAVAESRARLHHKQASLPQLLAASARGRDDPRYQRALEEIEMLRHDHDKIREANRAVVEDMLRSNVYGEQTNQLAQLQAQLDAAAATEKMLREQIMSETSAMEDTGSQTLELEFARSELEREEAVYDQIAHRALTMRTETRAPARVSLLKRAEVPEAPLEPFPLKLMVIAAAGSMALPFGLAIFREATIRRIAEAKDVERQIKTPVVSEVVRLPSRRQSLRSRTSAHTLHLYEESIDALRAGIVLAESHGSVQMLAVASAVSGEGKTSIAAQLALSLARASGEPTLLVDADLRSPDIHHVFGIENDLGLVSILRGESDLDRATYSGWGDSLYLLPAGELRGNPHRLVGGGRLEACLKECREKYRFVVIDTPPLLAASESLGVAKLADGVLLCTMRDYSRAKQVQSAHRRLAAAGVTPLGVVLNGVSLQHYSNVYGSYSYTRREPLQPADMS